MNPHPALRLTSKNSPFFRDTTPKSPSKISRGDEPGLQLRKVIGTTTATATAFDCLPEARAFAYTAGAAAVYATVGQDLSVTQRFFRARTTGNGREGNIWTASPTPNEPRNRTIGHVREHNVNGSPLASSGRDWSDSPTGRSTTAKDRVKAATSVAISPNGKWLAIGETGYKPRIAIFSLAEEASDLPVATLSEHSYGVHALRFSPDSRFLASLGTVNDGFLYIWNIDDKSGTAVLHASNKLTAMTNVLIWTGNVLVTAGLRFVKLWRPDEDTTPEPKNQDAGSSQLLSPRHRTDNRSSDYGNSILTPKLKTLVGKNSLLGDLLECNFVAAVGLPDRKAILCAESGEVCLLDDRESCQTINLIQTTTFGITAARLSPNGRLDILGNEGNSKMLESEAYLQSSRPSSRARRSSTTPMKSSTFRRDCVVASAAFGDVVVELDSERNITLRHEANESKDQSTVQLAAHREPVLGVRCVDSDVSPAARFFTFSANGILHFWNGEGSLIGTVNLPIPSPTASQGYPNELKSVAVGAGGGWIASGDKYGVLSLVDLRSRVTVTQARAHSAEIMDLAVFRFEDVDFVATAGRDRMVQLFAFTEGQLSLLQTMDEHAGAVTGILYGDTTKRLLTHSADRTVVLREAFLRDADDPTSLAFAMIRTIPLKVSPTSMCLAGEGELLVSTVDRSIARYKLKNGHCILTFKCSDNEGGEAVTLSKIAYTPNLNGNPTIAGISSSDKSVRLYTDYGSLLARDWGHSEGVTDICLINSPLESSPDDSPATRLITVAADSTIFIWNTTAPPHSSPSDSLTSPTHLDTPLGPPLRKILSQTELTRFRRKKSEPPSPSTADSSPQRVRKRPPILEPAFRAAAAASSPRQERLKGRSPSPPSPRNGGGGKKGLKVSGRVDGPPSPSEVRKGAARRTSGRESLGKRGGGGFASEGGVERLVVELRGLRKRLAAAGEEVSAEDRVGLEELEGELCLAAVAVGEKLRGCEGGMGRLLDEASSQLVGLLDGRIRERVEREVRKGSLARDGVEREDVGEVAVGGDCVGGAEGGAEGG